LTPRRLLTPGTFRKASKPLLLAVFASALAGCAVAVQKIPSPPELDSGQPAAAGWTADRLAGILAQREEQFRSLRSLASVQYRGPEGSQGFQEAILIQRPDRARLETLTLLGAILIVTVNADEIAGLHPREGLYLTGKSSRENLFRYTRIPLELEDMTRLLIGLPPVRSTADWQIGGDALYRALNGQGKEIVVFDLSRELPIRWHRLTPDGSPELSAAFDNFLPTPAGLFPSRITLEDTAQKRLLEIVYQEPELNVEIAPSLFNQEKPASAREVPIEALGG
jgi:outer membrane lipoprotein-sorting protein